MTYPDLRFFLLGTWQAAPGVVAEGVYHALKTGYRLLDCAYCYGNEAEVGQGLAKAIKEGIVKREDVYVVTKVWYVALASAIIQTPSPLPTPPSLSLQLFPPRLTFFPANGKGTLCRMKANSGTMRLPVTGQPTTPAYLSVSPSPSRHSGWTTWTCTWSTGRSS